MTQTQSNTIKDGINSFLTPILIVVVGWFIVQSLNSLTDRIAALERNDIDKDIWVLAWTERWQPTLVWAKKQMENE